MDNKESGNKLHVGASITRRTESEMLTDTCVTIKLLWMLYGDTESAHAKEARNSIERERERERGRER